MMILSLRDVTDVGYDMCTHATFHKELQRHYSRDTCIDDAICVAKKLSK